MRYQENEGAIFNPAFVKRVHRKREEERRRRQQQEAAIASYRVVHVLPCSGDTRAIIERVAQEHDVPSSFILSASRAHRAVAARDAAIRAVADERPGLSLPQIGRIFNRDHSTILHSLRKTRKEGHIR